MIYPTPHRVVHITEERVGENAAGQPITETRERERWVTSIRPRVNTTPNADVAVADRVIVECTMVTPEPDWPHGSTVIDPRGRRFKVEGDVEDYNLGPFGFTPGYLVKLREVTQRGA